MNKPLASLSLDLDNLWSYLKTHNEPGWQRLPTYLPRLVPRVLEWLDRRGKKITFFVVGQDAARAENREALRQIAEAGHEIANHSFHHEPWMQLATTDALVDELTQAHQAIQSATGRAPIGFRGPGFCYSPALLTALRRLGYEYDASLLPSILGPLARRYYMRGTRMDPEERKKRQDLFGRLSDGGLPLAPFQWRTSAGTILEIPVTTIPVFRVPFHLSYLIWLASRSRALALAYLRFGLGMCRLRGIEPSYLLHPLDFLGGEDAPELAFFPGMNLSGSVKLALADRFMDHYERQFEVLPLGEHARRLRQRGPLKTVDALPLPPQTEPKEPMIKLEAR